MKVGIVVGGSVGANAVDVLPMLAARPDILLADKKCAVLCHLQVRLSGTARLVEGGERIQSRFLYKSAPFLVKAPKI